MNLVVWSAFFRNLKRIICLTARFPDLSYHPIFAKLSGSRRQIFKGFEVLWTINILVPCYYLCPKFMVFSLSCNSFFYLTTLGAENTFRITNIHTVRLCRVCLKVRLPIAFGPEIVYKKLFSFPILRVIYLTRFLNFLWCRVRWVQLENLINFTRSIEIFYKLWPIDLS